MLCTIKTRAGSTSVFCEHRRQQVIQRTYEPCRSVYKLMTDDQTAMIKLNTSQIHAASAMEASLWSNRPFDIFNNPPPP